MGENIENEYFLSLLEEMKAIHESLRLIFEDDIFSKLNFFFKDKKQMRAYELADGKNSLRDIGDKVAVSKDTVKNWFNDLQKIGIIEKIGTQGSYVKKYSLYDLVYFASPSGKKENEE